MNDKLEFLKARRSCRSYKPDPVPKDLLDQVLEAGTYAATSMNRQSPIILAVTDRKTRDELSRVNAAVMGREGDPFYGAPAVLVVLARKDIPAHVYDGSLVMGELMHAAQAVGLATCWIHRARETFERPEGKALLASLGIPDEYEGIGNCIIGYPDGPLPEAKPRKEDWIYRVE